MANMTEERRKEMEEEMSRFELEIAGPGESKSSVQSIVATARKKPLTPPPAPPVVAALLPEVLKKAPPPPPPPLQPPPAPPALSVLSAQPPPDSVRFIPHQLHRQPPRHHPRPSFTPMRGPPMGGSPFPPAPFGSMNQGHPMGGHMPHGPIPPGGPMHPGGMMLPMPPGGMGMPPMSMGGNLPGPPGFCPPGPMAMPRFEPPSFSSSNVPNQNAEVEAPPGSGSSSESPSVVASAPTVYAAPFVKSLPEAAEAPAANGRIGVAVPQAASPMVPRTEKTQPTRSTASETTAAVQQHEEPVVSKKKEKKRKIVRMAGGQAWEDNSLMDWENDDFRIFCGDLGNDVTDEVLIRAFSKYSSFVRAKVVRDKRTNKTKGFGFVSFKDPQDFIKAMREMNGRYVGSRPIKLRKSTWKDRNMDIVKKKQREKEKLGLL